MTLADRNLREQTLFALYKNPPFTGMEEALRESLAQVTDRIYSTKGEWTRKKLVAIQTELGQRLKVNYKKLQKDLPKDLHDQVNTTSLFKLDATSAQSVMSLGLVQGYTPNELFNTVEQSHIRQLKVTLAGAVARGAPVNEIVKLLKDKNVSLTKSQLKTAIITVQNEARAATRHYNYTRMEDEGLIDGYVYNATLDGRTSEYCREHDGRTYWKPIKEIAGQINVHFRCRSVFIPTSKDLTTRASIHGPVENIRYADWFKNQDVDFQRTVLGRTKFNLFKEGKFLVQGLPDVMAGDSLEMETIAAMIGNVELTALSSDPLTVAATRQDLETVLIADTRFREAYEVVDKQMDNLNNELIAMRTYGKKLKLSDLEIKTVAIQTNEYTVRDVPGFMFEQINSQLRHESSLLRVDQLESFTRILNNTLDKLPKKKFKTLYRGVNFTSKVLEAHSKGKTVTYEAFTSTSASLAGSLDGNYTLVITPTRHNGGYLGNLSTHPKEEEFLFKPGTKFLVTSVDEDKSYIHLTEIE